MAVTIEPITLLATTYIAGNLRESDILELLAACPGMTPELWGATAPFAGPYSFVAKLNGNPAFAFGVMTDERAPHVGFAWGLGTDETPRVMLGVTRFVLKALVPELIRNGVRRVEVRVMQDHLQSLSWLTKKLGAKFETDLPGYGANGEPFLLLSWTKDSFNDVLFRSPKAFANSISPVQN